jgi:hypothetical protein
MLIFQLTAAILDKDNGKWFGTDIRCTAYVDKDGNRKSYNTTTTPQILSNYITCINQDNQGQNMGWNIWMVESVYSMAAVGRITINKTLGLVY